MAHNTADDHHFIIKQLAKEFEGQFEYFGEITEKYITFSVSIKKKIIIVKKLCTNKSLLVVIDLCKIIRFCG